MAKVKEQDNLPENPQEIITGSTSEEVQDNTSAPANIAKKKDSKEADIKIPDFVDAILKRFPGEEKLYVDNLGGTFTEKTAEIIRKGAILYKNPYYTTD